MAKCVWLWSQLVAQFTFLEWTADEKLRHVSFQGLRDDNHAREVVKEDEVPRKAPSRATIPRTRGARSL